MSERCRQCGKLEETNNGLCAECEVLQALPDATASQKTFLGKPFKDCKQIDEEQRFDVIVKNAENMRGKILGVMVDHGPGYEGKGDRYVAEILKRNPSIEIVKRFLMNPKVEVIKIKLPSP